MQFQNGAAEGGVLCIYTAEIVLFSVHCCIKTQMQKQRPSNKVLRRFWPTKVPLLSLAAVNHIIFQRKLCFQPTINTGVIVETEVSDRQVVSF